MHIWSKFTGRKGTLTLFINYFKKLYFVLKSFRETNYLTSNFIGNAFFTLFFTKVPNYFGRVTEYIFLDI
ncbi:hypothetical protein BpHYR1_047666 [Brachionus plicatilis]|uniref:Uncharacterized protein n=1 Tax=Brachionus plicatilis TaxID=10195 RepID=A0A3M7S122_BRAPC|nr:hypothetical protein BpHYR1_047666 [Brachionus plicatilis]